MKPAATTLLVIVGLLVAPGTAAAREATDPEATAQEDRVFGPVDWARAGVLIGFQYKNAFHERTSIQLEGKFSFFGLDWRHVYCIPVQLTIGGYIDPRQGPSGLGAFMVGGEVGYLKRWDDDEIRAGLAVGAAYGGSYHGSGIAGGGLRPTIRYRHYWGRFGLEVSLEWPTIVGEVPGLAIDDPGYEEGFGTGVTFWYALPLLGISIGM